MTHVVDLVGHVGADMQTEGPQERGKKQRPVHASLAKRDGAPNGDGQERGGEAERPDHLPRPRQPPSEACPSAPTFPSDAYGGGQGGGPRASAAAKRGVQTGLYLCPLL